MNLDKKEIEEKVKAKQALIEYYEELAYAIKNHGEFFLKELNSRENDFSVIIFEISNNPENEHRYSEQQLKTLHEIHVRRSEIRNLISGFNPEYLLKISQEIRKDIERLVETGNDNPVY